MVYKIFIINISAVKAYIYVANETPANIYFDDFSIKHTKAIKVIQENHFYPFGMSMKGLELRGNPDHRFKFNGIERVENFELNWDMALYRSYDQVLGLWGQSDPKYNYSQSVYSGFGNNPLRYVDPLGDTIYIFGSDGKYASYLDDGKEEVSGVYFKNTKVNKDGSTTYSDGVSFGFNDIEDDRENIKNGEYSVQLINSQDVSNFTQNAADFSGNSLSYIERESSPSGVSSMLFGTSNGEMDYYNKDIINDETIYIVFDKKGQAVGYNPKDFGNFLWGQAGRRLGFSLLTLKIGAHFNNAFRSSLNNALDDSFEYSILDSKGDQRAIRNGYFFGRKRQKGSRNLKNTFDY